MSQGTADFSGELNTRVIKPSRPHKIMSVKTPLGRLMFSTDKGSGSIFAPMYFQTNVHALHTNNNGEILGDYDLGSGLVTHAGVRLLSQDTAVSAGAATFNVMKFHASGTGTTAATATDTALQTAAAPTTTTAVTGTNTNADASPNATIQSQATVSYTSTLAITEWGLFNQATLSGATMWDRKVFTAINVASGDSIQFTYTLTINSGG